MLLCCPAGHAATRVAVPYGCGGRGGERRDEGRAATAAACVSRKGARTSTTAQGTANSGVWQLSPPAPTLQRSSVSSGVPPLVSVPWVQPAAATEERPSVPSCRPPVTRLSERRDQLHPRHPPSPPPLLCLRLRQSHHQQHRTVPQPVDATPRWTTGGRGGSGVGGEAPQPQATAPCRCGAATPPRRARLDFAAPLVRWARWCVGGGGGWPRARLPPSPAAAARPPQRGVCAADAAGRARRPHGGRQGERRRHRDGGRN